MTFPEEIYSSSINTPGRAFFFDVKKRPGQTRRLVMTQTRNGERERLTVYEEEVASFVEEVMKAVAAMGDRPAASPPLVDRYAEIRKTCPHAYEPWTDEFDQDLWKAHVAGTTLKELCGRFGRPPCSIESRLQKLTERNG